MSVLHDASGRSASARTLRIRGIAVAVVLCAVAVALHQAGTGGLTRHFTLSLVTNSIGEGLAPGAEVKFHGLNIGSVKSLESVGYNRQRITVNLDPDQARVLTSDTRAQFTSSNIFGTAAVELVSSGQGAPLRSDHTLQMDSDVSAASITGVLRQAQKLGSVLDSRELDSIFETLRRHVDLTSPTVKSYFDLAKMIADAQTTPFSESLSVVAAFVDGAERFFPTIELANALLDRLEFAVVPGAATQTSKLVHQGADLFNKIAKGLGDNLNWLVPATNVLTDLAVPSTYLLGSLAPAYDRLSGLLDRTGGAFRTQDGQVRMQIQIILDTAPGLAAALPAGSGQTQGGHR